MENDQSNKHKEINSNIVNISKNQRTKIGNDKRKGKSIEKKPVRKENLVASVKTVSQEETEDQSVKKMVKGFACPYDSCHFIAEVRDFDLDEKKSLKKLYHHDEEVHRTQRQHLTYQLVFHDLGEEEMEEDED